MWNGGKHWKSLKTVIFENVKKKKKIPVILSPWAIVIKILGSSKYHSQFVKWFLFQWNHLNYWKEILNLNLKNNNNKFWVCNIISIFFLKKKILWHCSIIKQRDAN